MRDVWILIRKKYRQEGRGKNRYFVCTVRVRLATQARLSAVCQAGVHFSGPGLAYC